MSYHWAHICVVQSRGNWWGSRANTARPARLGLAERLLGHLALLVVAVALGVGLVVVSGHHTAHTLQQPATLADLGLGELAVSRMAASVGVDLLSRGWGPGYGKQAKSGGDHQSVAHGVLPLWSEAHTEQRQPQA
jgi:hypothetical protein